MIFELCYIEAIIINSLWKFIRRKSNGFYPRSRFRKNMGKVFPTIATLVLLHLAIGHIDGDAAEIHTFIKIIAKRWASMPLTVYLPQLGKISQIHADDFAPRRDTYAHLAWGTIDEFPKGVIAVIGLHFFVNCSIAPAVMISDRVPAVSTFTCRRSAAQAENVLRRARERRNGRKRNIFIGVY